MHLFITLSQPEGRRHTEFLPTVVKSGILNNTIRSLFLLPFLIPSRKEMRKLTKTRPAKETEFHSMTSRNTETREKKMKHVYCHTEKHTFSFSKSKNGTQTPSLTPYSFPPSPSSSVSRYSIILRILKFLIHNKQ